MRKPIFPSFLMFGYALDFGFLTGYAMNPVVCKAIGDKKSQ